VRLGNLPIGDNDVEPSIGVEWRSKYGDFATDVLTATLTDVASVGTDVKRSSRAVEA
jgi:hypothetical protein